MHSVHEDEPVVFETRWAMVYLRGPLTRDQIAALMRGRKRSEPEERRKTPRPPEAPAVVGSAGRPLLPPAIQQRYLRPPYSAAPPLEILYQPALLGRARRHFDTARYQVDEWRTTPMLLLLPGR